MTISLVAVNYHASDEVAGLAAAVQDEVGEIVVVDHSESAAEADRLGRLGGVRVVAQANLGYGAGLNRGVREATGDLLVLCNPDVRPKPGAIETLCDHAVRPGVGAVGPTLIWDERHVWRLPQAQHVTWWGEWLAARRPDAARRRYLRQQWDLWSADGSIRARVVSGTFLVTTRQAFEASGGFDPAYFLFYEENDWCRRLERAGLECRVVPHALVRHEVGVSASAEGVHHLEASYRRYRRRWFPRWYTVVYPAPLSPSPRRRPVTAEPATPPRSARWVVSPTEAFVPAAVGPPLQGCPGFPPGLPERIVAAWFAGWMDGSEIVNRGPASALAESPR